MKKTITLLLFVLSFLSYGQEKKITIESSVSFTPKIKEYYMTFNLVLNKHSHSHDDGSHHSGHSHDNDDTSKKINTLDDLKKDFFKLMKTKGIPSSKFKETPLNYMANRGLNPSNNSVCLTIYTDKREDITIFQSLGYPFIEPIRAPYGIAERLSDNLIKKLTKEALEKAKTKANITAKILGVTLGNVISISSSSDISEKGIVSFDGFKNKFKLIVSYSYK